MQRWEHQQTMGKGQDGQKPNLTGWMSISTCCTFLQIVNAERLFPAHLRDIFSPNKVYHSGNYIDFKKERIWPIYNTVTSPLFSGALRSYSLYAIICPLVIPMPIITSTGKKGESQINPFNYLLVMLVKGQSQRMERVLHNKFTS